MKQPDRKAPRFRHTEKRVLNSELVEKIQKLFPNLKLSRKDIRFIINTFNSLCADTIAETRDGIELPEQLGYVVLGKCKTKEFWSPDHKKTWIYDTRVDFTNYESNQWVCKVFYSNFAHKYRFKNCKYWGFEASRPLKQKVSKAFIKWHTKYIIADDYYRINKVYKENKKALKIKLEQQKQNPE